MGAPESVTPDWRVGLFFHVLYPADHPDEQWRGKPKEQGRVIRALGNEAYEIVRCDWVWGEPMGHEIKPLSYFDGAAWYPTEKDWVRAGARGLGHDEDESLKSWSALKEIDKETATRRPRKPRQHNEPSRAISKKLRFKIFMRDGFKCRYCGRSPPAVELHVDHVVPLAKGGLDVESNLGASCAACNMGKRDKSLPPEG